MCKKRFEKENLKEVNISSNFKYLYHSFYFIGYTQMMVWSFYTKLFQCLLSITHVFTTFASWLSATSHYYFFFNLFISFNTFLFDILLYFSSHPILIVFFRCFIRYLHINILSLVRFLSAFLLFYWFLSSQPGRSIKNVLNMDIWSGLEKWIRPRTLQHTLNSACI